MGVDRRAAFLDGSRIRENVCAAGWAVFLWRRPQENRGGGLEGLGGDSSYRAELRRWYRRCGMLMLQRSW